MDIRRVKVKFGYYLWRFFLTPYFERVLVDSNLMLSNKAIVSNATCNEVYNRIYRHIKANIRIDGTDSVVLNQLLIERKREPEYLLLNYDNHEGLHSLIPIVSYTEIHLRQIGSSVEVLVKMYKAHEHQKLIPFGVEYLTKEKARISWVDFILEIYKVAEIDNYDAKADELIPIEIQLKRMELEELAKKQERKIAKYLVLFFIVILILIIIYNATR